MVTLYARVIFLFKLVQCINFDKLPLSSTEANFYFNTDQFGRSNNQTDDIVSTIYSTVASVSKELNTGVPYNATYDAISTAIYSNGNFDDKLECKGTKSEEDFTIRPSNQVCDFQVIKNHSGICNLELKLIGWNGDCRDSWLEAGGRLECGTLTGTRLVNFNRNSVQLRMRSSKGILVVKQIPCNTQITPPSISKESIDLMKYTPQDPLYPAPYIPPNLRPTTFSPDINRQKFPIESYNPTTQPWPTSPSDKNTILDEISNNKIDSMGTVQIPSSKYPVLIYQPNKDQSLTSVYRPYPPQSMFPGMRYGPPECDKNTGVVVSSPGYPNVSPPGDCTLVLHPTTRLCSPFIYFDYFEFGNAYGSSCQNTFFEIGGYRLCGCLSGMSWRVPDFIFTSEGSLRMRFKGQGRLLITVYFNTCHPGYSPYPPSQRQSWRCQQYPFPSPNPRPDPIPYPPSLPRPLPPPKPLWPTPTPPQPYPDPGYPPKQPPPQPPFPYPPRQPSPFPPFPYPPKQPNPQPPVLYPPQPRPVQPFPYPQPPIVYPSPEPRPQPPVVYPPKDPRPQPPTPMPFPRPYPMPLPDPYPTPGLEPYPGCKIIRDPQGSINCAPLQPQHYCYRFEPPTGYCQMVVRIDEVSMTSSQNCHDEYLTTGIRNPRICQENVPMYLDRGGYLQGKLMGGSSVKATFQGLPCSCNVEYRQPEFVLRGTPSQDSCQYTIHKYNEGICSLELTLDTIDLQCGIESLLIDEKSYCGLRANEKIDVPFLEPTFTIRYMRLGQPSKPGSFSIQVQQSSRCVQPFSAATGRDIKYREDCSQPLTGVYGNIDFFGATRNPAQYLACSYGFLPKQGYCFVRLDFDEVEIPNTLDCSSYYIQINRINYCGNTLSSSTKVLVLDQTRGAEFSYKADKTTRWSFTYSLLPCKQEILARAQNT